MSTPTMSEAETESFHKYSVDQLLSALRGMEAQKDSSIKALIQERVDLLANAKIRCDEIESALKLLGYKRKRGPRKTKTTPEVIAGFSQPASRKR